MGTSPSLRSKEAQSSSCGGTTWPGQHEEEMGLPAPSGVHWCRWHEEASQAIPPQAPVTQLISQTLGGREVGSALGNLLHRHSEWNTSKNPQGALVPPLHSPLTSGNPAALLSKRSPQGGCFLAVPSQAPKIIISNLSLL